MNWSVIILIGLLLLVLVIFLVLRNIKDEKKFERDINRDTYKREEDSKDNDADEVMH